MKGQAVADFVAEMTPNAESEMLKDCAHVLAVEDNPWKHYVDGSSNHRGCEVGLLIVSPEGERFEYALRLMFRASNNEAEYEALLAGLRVANILRVENLLILSDFQLVVNQVAETYQDKE